MAFLDSVAAVVEAVDQLPPRRGRRFRAAQGRIVRRVAALAAALALTACGTLISGTESGLKSVDLAADQVTETGCTGLAKYSGLVGTALSVGAIVDPAIAATGKVLLGFGTGACDAATGAITAGVDKGWVDDLDQQLNRLLPAKS